LTLFYSATRLFASGCFGLLTGWDVRGREHIPREGGLLIASNHISFWDPPMVGSALPREVHFLAKEELFRTPGLGWLIRSLNSIPIRRGVADLSGLARALEVLRQGDALLLFPEGSRMRDGELHPPRPGVGMMAVQADVPIVPCYISGSNRPSRWWRRGVKVRLWFGRPRHWKDLIDPETDLTPGRLLYQKVGEGVMREIAILKTGQETAASRGAA